MIVGVGCDIVKIERVKLHQEALAKKILTDKEYQIFNTLVKTRRTEYLAGRFAAKEAVIKAFPKTLYMLEIEILNDENGKPYCCNFENYRLHISISHEEDNAIAYCICEQ